MSAIVRVKDANGNVSSIPAIKGDKGDPADLATIQQKASIDDADLVLVADSTSNKSGKLVLWSTIKTALSNLYLGKTGDASNVTNAFTTAATKTDLTTGEKLSVSLGKIQKWFSSLGTAAFTASTAYDASGAASGAVSTHNSASDAHSTLFAAKANTSALSAHAGATNNPHGVTKSQVGLGNADNTADANKPVSTAQQTALDNKAGKKVPATTGNLAALDAAGNLADSGHLPAYFQQATDGLTAETTLDDADVIPFYDASATAHRKSTWANLKAKIKTALFGSVSGIPKLNGSGGVSPADAAALKTLLDTLASVSPATDDKIPLTDISGAAAGYSTIADVLALVTPGAQIAVGTYTGTGVFGSPNKNSLTFPFTPKFVMIMNAQHGFCGIGDCFSVRWGLSTAPRLWADGGQYNNEVAAYSGNTMTWYNNNSAAWQLNEAGIVYAYIAFT